MTTQTTPSTDTSGQIGIDPEQIVQGYRQALADATERAILAEAAVQTLRRHLDEARETIAALSPGAPDEQETTR